MNEATSLFLLVLAVAQVYTVEEFDKYEEYYPEKVHPFIRNYEQTNHNIPTLSFPLPPVSIMGRHKLSSKDPNMCQVPCSSLYTINRHQDKPQPQIIYVSGHQPTATQPQVVYQPQVVQNPQVPVGQQQVIYVPAYQFQQQNANQYQGSYQGTSQGVDTHQGNKVIVITGGSNNEIPADSFQLPEGYRSEPVVDKEDFEKTTFCHIKSMSEKHEIACNPRTAFPLVTCKTMSGDDAYCTSHGPDNGLSRQYMCSKIEDNNFFCNLK